MTVAHYYLSQIKGRTVTDDEFADLQDLERRDDLTPNSMMYMHFGLFRAYDQRGDFDSAFRHLAAGNAIKADSTPYDDADTASYIAAILDSAKAAIDRHGDSPDSGTRVRCSCLECRVLAPA